LTFIGVLFLFDSDDLSTSDPRWAIGFDVSNNRLHAYMRQPLAELIMWAKLFLCSYSRLAAGKKQKRGQESAILSKGS
jgi:hypothetical protein